MQQNNLNSLTILFVANRFPFPPHRGDKLKIFNLAKRLAQNHKLILITFTQDKEDLENVHALDRIFDKVITIHLPKYKSILNCFRIFIGDKSPLQVLYFRSKLFRKKLKEVLKEENIDVVHVQHLRMSQYVNELKGYPKILDLPDAFSLYWERRVHRAKNSVERLFNSFELKRVVKYEKIMLNFDNCLACSTEDVTYLNKLHGFNHLKVFPNGVDLSTFKSNGHDYSQNNVLLFTGNMNYAPNVDAVLYFAKDIFPLLQKQFSDLRFVIAGQKPVEAVLGLAGNGVEVTGFVEHMADWYKKATIVVAPLRFGAGTQNKVLEAMAMGVPVVCSKIGFEGLGIKSGEGVFLGENKDSFSEHIQALLLDANLRKKTGELGKEVVKSKFDWDSLATLLDNYLTQVVHGKS